MLDNRLSLQCRRVVVGASSYCYAGHHARVVTPGLHLHNVQRCPRHCQESMEGPLPTKKTVPTVLGLQTPRPATEPRTPKSPKVHFKVRKIPFWTRKNGRKSQFKCPPFSDMLSPQKCICWTFKLTFGAIFPGVQNGIFRTLRCTFGVLGFRGSVAGRGDCNTGGSTIPKLIWGANLLYFPGLGDLQPYETWKFRICSESVSRVFPDLLRIWVRKS